MSSLTSNGLLPVIYLPDSKKSTNNVLMNGLELFNNKQDPTDTASNFGCLKENVTYIQW